MSSTDLEWANLLSRGRAAALIIYQTGGYRFPRGARRGEFSIARRVAMMILGDHHKRVDEMPAAIELDLVSIGRSTAAALVTP